MSKILVTGSTGFVGKSLIPALILSGHQVRCAVTQKTEWIHCEQVVVDRLENQIDWNEALDGIDVVIHLAARVHIMNEKNKSPLDEYIKINSVSTRNLAEQAAKKNVKRFIFLSSIKVNGEETLANCPFTEASIPCPNEPYAISKLYAEHYLQAISRTTNMEVVILRPPLIYGPGVKANFLKMIKLVNKNWPLPFGKVHNKRNFVYIDNLISAITTVISLPNAANQIYLVADNDALSFSDLLNQIAKEMKLKSNLFSLPVSVLNCFFRLPGLKKFSSRLLGSLEVSNLKIKSDLGWEPPVSTYEGIEKTVKWYQNEYIK